MTGVVLCGGQSKRMGTDKGLLKSYNTTWVEGAVAKLKTLSIPVKIAVNSKQFVDYSKNLSQKDLVTDNESLKIKGPLCGVLSVYLEQPFEDILVLACDMPLMQTEILKELAEQYHQHPEAEAIAFTHNSEPEPLCGIYTAKGLGHIYDLYIKDQLPKHSMKYILERISTYLIPLPDDKKKYFTNINIPAELNGL